MHSFLIFYAMLQFVSAKYISFDFVNVEIK